MSMIQNAAIFSDAPPAAVLPAGRGTDPAPRASSAAGSFAHLLQGRRASRQEAAETAVQNRTDKAPAKQVPVSVERDAVTEEQVASEESVKTASTVGEAAASDPAGPVSQLKTAELPAEAGRAGLEEAPEVSSALLATSGADLKQGLPELAPVTNGAEREESLTAYAVKGGPSADAETPESVQPAPVKTKGLDVSTAAGSDRQKEVVFDAHQGMAEARPEAQAAVVPAERAKDGSPAAVTAGGQSRTGVLPIRAAEAQLLTASLHPAATGKPTQEITAAGSAQQENHPTAQGGRPGGATAEGFVPTFTGGLSQASPAAPATAEVKPLPAAEQALAAEVPVQEESQPTAVTSATEDAQKGLVSAGKVPGQATALPPADQPPVQPTVQPTAEKGGQPVADKKDVLAAEGRRVHGTEKGGAEQAVATPKGLSEQAFGIKAAAADPAAAPVSLQGSAGGNGSGDAGKKGHPEQNAQAKLPDHLQPSGLTAQGVALAEVPQPEAKPANLKSALHESVLSQIKDGVVSHDGKGNGQMSIRLNPGELGELKIQVRMEDNRLRVEVQADNRMVKDLLMNNLESLKEALSGKNFTMEGFDVSTGGGGFNSPLPEQKGGSRQQSMRFAKAGYPGQEERQVNYSTPDGDSLLDVRF